MATRFAFLVSCIGLSLFACSGEPEFTEEQFACMGEILPSAGAIAALVQDGWPDTYPEAKVRLGMRIRTECEKVDCVALAEELHGPLNADIGGEAQEELIPVCWDSGLPAQWKRVRPQAG